MSHKNRKTPELLIPAIRQYRHNNNSGFIFGYDTEEADKAFNDIQAKNTALNNLITECTEHGELDPRLFNSYIEYFLKSQS